MLELKEIRIKNLGVFKEDTFNFKKGLNILVGINLDKSNPLLKKTSFENLLNIDRSNLASNGSGKSLIEESIALCLLGIVIRPKITIRELITEGQDFCEIELICENKYLKLTEISIKRTFFFNKNKTSKIEIFETDTEGNKKEIKYNVAGGLDKYILDRYIGISKENLLNYFILNETKYTPFLALSDTKKKELLSNLMGLEQYDFVNEEIEEELSSKDIEINEITNEISKIQGEKDAYQNLLNELPSVGTLEKNREEEIKNLKLDIKNVEEKQTNIKNQKQKTKENILRLESLIKYWKGEKLENFKKIQKNNKYIIKKLDLTKNLSNIKTQIKEVEEAITGAEFALKRTKKEFTNNSLALHKIKSILKNLIKCPKCGYQFDATEDKGKEYYEKEEKNKEKQDEINKERVEQVKKDLEEIQEYSDQLKKQKEDLEEKLDFYEIKIKRIDNLQITLLDYIKEKERAINLEKESIKILITKIENYSKEEIKNLNKKINALQETSCEKELQSKKEEYLRKIEEVSKKEEEIMKKKSLQNSCQQNLLDCKVIFKKFKDYIFEKYIYNIELLCNNYLSQLTNLTIKILTKKQLVSGKESDEINVKVLRNGREINFWVLSSGEKELINLSFILTFQSYINMSTPNGLNILILDEITAHIDSYFQNIIEEFLNTQNKNILFVSHVPAKSSNIKQTYIVKKDNISNIIEI